MTNKHCYLFALEVKPMVVGDIYDELPLHCTLIHRFWTELAPDELSSKVQGYFEQSPSVLLNAHERLLLGPKQVAVSELELNDTLKSLHMDLYNLLNDIGVEYTAPEWVGDGYRAHITERPGASLPVGEKHLSSTVYLIEVNIPEYEHKRLVRSKFSLINQN